MTLPGAGDRLPLTDPRYDAVFECPDCGARIGEDDECCGACRKRRAEEYEAMQWGEDGPDEPQ